MISRPAATAARIAEPRSTPGIERSEPVPSLTARVAVPGDDAGGPPKTFDKAAGDEPDDAFVPSVGSDDDDRARRIVGDLAIGDGQRFFEHKRLDVLAFLVQAIEQLGDALRFDRIGRRQQRCAQRGVADASARIDARPEI